MANKNLTDLTARTATADSDLIHVNSGGTDYKETKANFLSNITSSISSINSSLTKTFPTITKHSSITSDTAIFCSKYGMVVYISGYFKINATIATGQRLIVVTGLTGAFQRQYGFIYDGNNNVACRIETTTETVNGVTHPALAIASNLSSTTQYLYIGIVLMTA